jgi:hypothetical protein
MEDIGNEFAVEYLTDRIKEMKRAHRHWKRSVRVAIAVAFMFLLCAGFVVFGARLRRARVEAELARWQAEQRLRWQQWQELRAGKHKE